MTREREDDVLPTGFASQLAQLVAPTDLDEVSAILHAAASAPEPELTAFLSLLASRIRTSPAPLTATEVRALRAQSVAAG